VLGRLNRYSPPVGFAACARSAVARRFIFNALSVESELLNRNAGGTMLYYALVFLLVAIVCAILGFGVLSAVAASIAKILFFIFLVVFLVSLVVGRRRVL
jgi:uncharacterized membrane protein YtjA (UPF0391 family)